MGWRTFWLILKLMLIARARATATAEALLPCQPVVWASDGGKWSVGDTGQVFCNCDSIDDNAAHLRLLRNGLELETNSINSTTVVYLAERANETVQDTYECWAGIKPLKSVQVTVFARLDLEGLPLTCRFRSQEQLSCRFRRVEEEDFWNVTRYHLTVGTGLPEGSLCTSQPDNPARMQCVLTTIDMAQKYALQDFKLTMLSDLGGWNQTVEYHLPTVEMLVPEWPADTMKMTLNNNQRCLSWTNAQDLVNKKLEWLLELRPRRLGIPLRNETLPGNNKTDERTLTFCFNEPPQANQIFDVRLKMGLKLNETKTNWSEYYPEFNFTTNADSPARPPQFLPNGFYYKKNSRQLTVFWFELEELEHNGPNLTYEALCDGSKKADRYGSSSATFEDWDATKQANVSVWSRNIKGFSVNSSWLLVPAMNDVGNRQSTFLQYNPANFTLTWDKPEYKNQLKGYNVYWCNASADLGHFCQDGAHIHHISLENGDRLEYTFTSSMALMDMAISANYSDQVSGGMNLRLVGDVTRTNRPFVTKGRIMEGIGALLVLSLVFLTAKKLRKMGDIRVELPVMSVPKLPEYTPPPTHPVMSATSVRINFYERNPTPESHDHNNIESVELRTFPTVEEELEEDLVPESGPYVAMGNGIGFTAPPPPRSQVTGDGYIMPPRVQLILNNEGYIDPQPPRLIPNNEGYIDPQPPRLGPNNRATIDPRLSRLNPNMEGYVEAPPPRLSPDNNVTIGPHLPRLIPYIDGYVEAPSPRSNPNNDAAIDPRPPRLIPNSDGYVVPPPPRLSPDNNATIDPGLPRLNPNIEGYVEAPPPRLSPDNNATIDPRPPRLIPYMDGYVEAPPPRLNPNNDAAIDPRPPLLIPYIDGYVEAPLPRLNPNNDAAIDPRPPRLIPNSDGYVVPPPPRLSHNVRAPPPQ